MAAAGLNPGAEHRMVIILKKNLFYSFVFFLFRQENDIIKISLHLLNLLLL
jgi:hypothetical protein